VANRPDEKEVSMKIEVKGRNVSVTDELREHVEKRFMKISRQVSDLARLEVELCHERNPSNPDAQVVDATLYLKGATLRARDASTDFKRSVNMVNEELGRQVVRHREKRRRRREARAPSSGVQPAI
jgi:ribosome hibernation promoting factor